MSSSETHLYTLYLYTHLFAALSIFSLVTGLYVLHFSIALILVNKEVPQTRGMLYPRESETREVRSLDGIWNFVRSDQANPTQGVRDEWYAKELSKSRPTIPMPVPASYNDITTDNLRDHVGTVWYDRKFFVPRSWSKDQRIWLRFGSVHYEAYVVGTSNIFSCNQVQVFSYLVVIINIFW